MPPRPRVDWMTRSDDAILEFLLNDPGEPIRASPIVIEANIDFSKSTVRKRVGELLSEGLIQYYSEKSGIYELTEKGVAYLNGELTVEELEK